MGKCISRPRHQSATTRSNSPIGGIDSPVVSDTLVNRARSSSEPSMQRISPELVPTTPVLEQRPSPSTIPSIGESPPRTPYRHENWSAEPSGLPSHVRTQAMSPPRPRLLEHKYLSGGYWPSWKALEGLSPSSVPLDSLTHIHYAFASIDGDGTVFLEDEHLHFEKEVDGTNGCLRAWTQRKKEKPELIVTLSIGGGSPEAAKIFADVAGNSKKLFNFVHSAKKLVHTFQLDGVDIDWEEPANVDQGGSYLGLLATLRIVLGDKYCISTAIGNGMWSMAHLKLPAISEYVDFFNVMLYDFVCPTFSHTEKTGHHSQLFYNASQDPDEENCGHDTIKHMLELKVPSRKIMFGIPLYGYSFRGANGPYQEFQGPGSGYEGAVEVNELPRLGMTEVFDEEAVAAYAFDDGEFVTYDNKETVRRKAEYARSKKLLGLFYWHLGGDKAGAASLVKTGHDALSGAT